MPYNPNIHHRRSIRLKGYDYSQAGLYFITICVKDRACLFGKIVNDEMVLNDAGRMVEKWYFELENKFPNVKCHEMVVMPNHFHCIVENVDTVVGADLRVCPKNATVEPTTVKPTTVRTIHGQTIHGVTRTPGKTNPTTTEPTMGEHVGSPLHRTVQWFKTMSTNEYIRGVKQLGWTPFNGKLWQRNYWENIIRSEQSYHRISNYIINNPKNWKGDKFY